MLATIPRKTIMIPVKPIPSMAIPATVAANTIASNDPPISLIRVIRLRCFSSAEPRPIEPLRR